MIKQMEMSNGVRMPIIGYGTWLARENLLCDGLKIALDTGYRHIDTAYIYENEDIVGDVLKEWFDSGRLKREDVFVTTKLPGYNHRRDDVDKAIRESLEKLKLDYVDLYLIHSPLGFKKGKDFMLEMFNDQVVPDIVDHLDTWRGMEDVLQKGLTRSIGLSNFNIQQMERIIKNCTVKPQNLQVECHLYFPQTELQEFCKKHDIVMVAYAPLGSPGRLKRATGSSTSDPAPLKDPVVNALAKKLNKTPGQIQLRWLIQRDIVIIPKSITPERIRENFNVFDFCLSSEDMKLLNDIKIRERLYKFEWGRKNPDYPFELPQH